MSPDGESLVIARTPYQRPGGMYVDRPPGDEQNSIHAPTGPQAEVSHLSVFAALRPGRRAAAMGRATRLLLISLALAAAVSACGASPASTTWGPWDHTIDVRDGRYAEAVPLPCGVLLLTSDVDDPERTLVSLLRAGSGRPAFTSPVALPTRLDAFAAACDDRSVFVATPHGVSRINRADGTTRWTTQLELTAPLHVEPHRNGLAVVERSTGRVVLLRADGEVSRDVTRDIPDSTGLATDGERLVLLATVAGGELIAIDALRPSAPARWAIDAPTDLRNADPVAGSPGALAMWQRSGQVIAIDPRRGELLTFDATQQSAVAAPPAGLVLAQVVESGLLLTVSRVRALAPTVRDGTSPDQPRWERTVLTNHMLPFAGGDARTATLWSTDTAVALDARDGTPRWRLVIDESPDPDTWCSISHATPYGGLVRCEAPGLIRFAWRPPELP